MLPHDGFMGALSEYYSYWIMQTLAMLLTAALIPRLRITSIFGAIGIVACLGFVNSTVWDAALFFSVPSSFTMQAITLLLSNGVLFWILVKVLPGIEVRGVAAALVLLLTVGNLIFSDSEITNSVVETEKVGLKNEGDEKTSCSRKRNY